MAEKSKKQEKQVSTSSNQLVPTSNQLAISPADIANRYQVLGQIPKTRYNSALAYPPVSQNYTPVNQNVVSDPFCSAQPIQSSKPRISYPTKHSNYIPKSQSTNLFHIEPAFKNIQNPLELAKAFFPPGWHFIPHHPGKSIQFYKDILLQHKSVVIKSIQDQNNPNITIYHSLYIHDIINLDEWGHPSCLRNLPGHSIQYNYYDYIEAWSKVILHENENYNHSWFFQFDQKFKSVFPTWFVRWWAQYGAISEIIPNDLMDQVTYFSSLNKVDSHTSQFPSLLLFMAKYKVPWIFKWRYDISDNTVTRQFLVKWWDKFNQQRIIDQVKIEFPVNVPTPVQQISQSKAATTLTQSSTPLVSTIRLGSPNASSSGPSKAKAKAKSRSSELLKLAQQLIAQASQDEDDESSEESATATSQQDPYSSLFQDAQDPYA